MTTTQAHKALARLTPGTIVGHANPELADWKGAITANTRGNYQRPETGDVWVTWYAGDVPAGLPATGWMEATALTIAGQCPDCARPAHLILKGNYWDRSEGWHHDSRVDMNTCWCGKAAFEAGQRPTPILLAGCTCGGIGDTGDHSKGCPWAP